MVVLHIQFNVRHYHEINKKINSGYVTLHFAQFTVVHMPGDMDPCQTDFTQVPPGLF